ncbi:MAG: hypothetical protein WCK52_00020 [Betaproteobacteria bacterium]
MTNYYLRLFLVTLLGMSWFPMCSAQTLGSKFVGPYLQAGIGYMNISPSITETVSLSSGALYSPSNVATNSISGIAGNIGGGYNFKVANHWLLGVGIEVTPTASASAQTTLSFPNLPNIGPYSGSYQAKNAYNLYITPGYELKNDELIYGKLAFSGATVQYSDSLIGSTSINMTGYSVGMGYKKAYQSSFYAYVEGMYSNFSNQTFATSATIGATSVTPTLSIGASAMTFLIGGGYRF